jgi:FkbM family methyltransferase
VVVDVGANIGLFAVYAAMSGAAKVYAFEPNREAYRCMVDNIRRNDLQHVIVPYNHAVTSRSNEIVMIPRTASPQNRIVRGDADHAAYEPVKTISVNDIVSKEGLACVNLLKMDCEGSEYDILAGMSASTFSKIDRIIVEYHDGGAERIEKDLQAYGFTLEKAEPETKTMGMLWFRRRNGMRAKAS